VPACGRDAHRQRLQHFRQRPQRGHKRIYKSSRSGRPMLADMVRGSHNSIQASDSFWICPVDAPIRSTLRDGWDDTQPCLALRLQRQQHTRISAAPSPPASAAVLDILAMRLLSFSENNCSLSRKARSGGLVNMKHISDDCPVPLEDEDFEH
jgi:hypothetical protein